MSTYQITLPTSCAAKISQESKMVGIEGFPYPKLKLINKQSRAILSGGYVVRPETSYHLFAISNRRGWFIAARRTQGKHELIASPVSDLQEAQKDAKENNHTLFEPKRVVPLPQGKPNLLRFTKDESILFVGLENGQILRFDAASLLVPGVGQPVQPTHALELQEGPLRAILPNPADAEKIAIVGNGYVSLFTINLELLGKWESSDPNTIPTSAAWSPTGKTIALGLRSGEVLTYQPGDMNTVKHHLPSVYAKGSVASVHWPGPSLDIMVTYSFPEDPIYTMLYVISVDLKTNTGIHWNTMQPFPAEGRTYQSPCVVELPGWDEPVEVAKRKKSLYIYGDSSSMDLEVMGRDGTEWWQESQESPTTLPLNMECEDTTLLGLTADLSETQSSSTPILYAYLDDGSIQAWYIDHPESKPYPLMVKPVESSTVEEKSNEESNLSMAMQDSSFPTASAPTTSVFGGQPSTSAFGQSTAPAFPTSPTPAFQSTPAAPAFPTSPTPAFQSTPAAPAFPSTSNASPFGAASQQGGGFAAFSGQSSAFGGSTAATQPSAFDNASAGSDMTRETSMADDTSTGFGGFGLGSGHDSNKTSNVFGSFGSTPAVAAPSAPSGGFLGQPKGLGASVMSTDSPFARATTTAPSTGGAFGSAFGSPSQLGGASSAFGQSGFGQRAAPAFGASGFGQPSTFGQSSMAPSTSGGFGQFANKPATFGNTGAVTSPSGGGFASFANQPATLGTKKEESTQPSGGFGGFSGGTSTFGAKPAQTGGFAGFANQSATMNPKKDEPTQSTGAFGGAFGGGTSVFGASSGQPSTGFGAFGGQATPFGVQAKKEDATMDTPVEEKPSSTPTAFGISSPFAPVQNSPFGNKTPMKPSGLVSPSSSPEPGLRTIRGGMDSDDEESPISQPTQSADISPGRGLFGNVTPQPSKFALGEGHGVFGAPSADSPFMKKAADQGTSSTGTPLAFSTSPAQQPTSVFAQAMAGAASAPKFGQTSWLNVNKSAFSQAAPSTPSPTPSSGGFSAFAGASASPFGNAGKQSETDKALSAKLGAAVSGKGQTAAGEDKDKEPQTTSVFAALKKESEKAKEKDQSPPKPAAEKSIGSLSISSAGSSYVNVQTEDAKEASKGVEEEEQEVEEGEDEEDDRSEDYESSDSYDEFLGAPESDDEESEGEEEEALSPPTSPRSGPRRLDQGRSPTITPAEVPEIQVTPTPYKDALLKNTDEVKERTGSTTPPGTPEKEKAASAPPIKAPTPGPSSSFGLGLGRPSTRPARSSPLAGTPLSSDDGDDDDYEDEEDTTKKPTPSSSGSKTAFLKDEATDALKKRPQTPPLLSAFGTARPISMPPTTALAPATPPVRPASTPQVSSNFFAAPPSVPAPQTEAGKSSNPFGNVTFPLAPPSTFGMKPPQAAETKDAAPTGLFGAAAPSQRPGTSTPFNLQPFSLKPSAPAPAVPMPVFASSNSAAPSLTFPAAPPAAGMFGQQSAGASSQQPSPFGKPFNMGGAPPARTKTPDLSGMPKMPALIPKAQPAPPPVPEMTMEEGMQKECAMLVVGIRAELDKVQARAKEAAAKLQQLNVSAGGSWHKEDLGNEKKWGLGDIKQFGQVMMKLTEDLDSLEEKRDAVKQSIRELSSSMLKAGTRREEITRFTKAQTDPEFAKMLKARHLGPEHSEAQTHLRRTMRATRDRITKLEEVLQASKRKVNESSSGRVSIKAPTLDTVNRTFRNIELAISQQADEISKLANRVSEINLQENALVRATSTRDGRLPDPIRRKPDNVTPNVAEVTAAALNAERSAHRLKKALLAIRKEPLLNVNVTTTKAPPVVFNFPDPVTADGIRNATDPLAGPVQDVQPPTPMNFAGLVFAPITPVRPGPSSGGWSPEPHAGEESTTPVRRGATGPKKHSTVQLKRDPGSTPSPVAKPTFEWGPLPSFSGPPLSSLAAPFARFDGAKKA